MQITDSTASRFEVQLEYKSYTKKSAEQDYYVEFYKIGFKIYRKGGRVPMYLPYLSINHLSA